ncbi:MAG TPA: TIGR03621 family F420-dependent LLM class oxidoreductase [Acidimicrobiales bacterium]|nr:TIGR03621 family F420-dependent LLM class oxidoreductase [Acidimicrobiales bacterium]
MPQPFRFAVQTSSAPDAKAWRERARQIEGLGYSTLYIPDHFGDQWGPLVALTIAAEATSTLNVGSLVFDNDYRHPVVLAKEIATLDLASEGRVEFGIGAGWMTSDYDESGITLDKPSVRIKRMEEGLAIMKAMWADGTATFKGEHYEVDKAQGQPRPHSRPGPKIVIGGGGQKVLSIAAREADIIGVNPNLAAGRVGPEVAASAVAERYRERIDWIKQAAGARFDDIELQSLCFFVQVVPNRDEVIAQMAPLFNLSPEEAAEVPMTLVGTVEEICDTIEQRREEYGFSYWVVHDPEIESFAPVVERLAGK